MLPAGSSETGCKPTGGVPIARPDRSGGGHGLAQNNRHLGVAAAGALKANSAACQPRSPGENETTLPRWQGSSLFQDAQSGEESTDLRCVSAKCLRDVGYAHGPQQADHRISEGSHHFRTGTLADPARVLAHCDVTYVVRTILDRPMPPGPFE